MSKKANSLSLLLNSSIAEEGFWDHVYLRHLSTEYRWILSADMSTDSRPISRPILGRYVGRDSTDISTNNN